MAEQQPTNLTIPVEFTDGQALDADQLNQLQQGLLNAVLNHTHTGNGLGQQLGSAAISPGAINHDHLAAGAVHRENLAPGSVGRTELKYGAVQEGHIEDGAVSALKIRDENVTEPKLSLGVREKLNAPRDGATTFGYCAFMNGRTNNEGFYEWFHWIYDPAMWAFIRPQPLQRLHGDGVWHPAERVGPPAPAAVRRPELAAVFTRFFREAGLNVTKEIQEVTVTDYSAMSVTTTDGTVHSYTTTEARQYLDRYQTATNLQSLKVGERLVTRYNLHDKSGKISAALTGSLENGNTFSQLNFGDGDTWWVASNKPSGEWFSETLTSRQLAWRIVATNGAIPVDLTDLLAQACRYAGKLNKATLAADIRTYMQGKWPYVKDQRTVDRVEAIPEDKRWRVVFTDSATLLLTDAEMALNLRGYLDPANSQMATYVSWMLTSITSGSITPWNPASVGWTPVSATPSAELPGELPDRTHLRLVNPTTVWWTTYGGNTGNSGRSATTWYPGVPGNSVFDDAGNGVQFQVNQVLTEAEKEIAERVLFHVGAVPLRPVQNLMGRQEVVDVLNNPALLPAGYWTGPTRNIKAVMRMSYYREMMPQALAYVRICFERPYKDVTYAVNVCPDPAGEPVSPQVLARTRHYVDIGFYTVDKAPLLFGDMGYPLTDVDFSIAIHGELDYA